MSVVYCGQSQRPGPGLTPYFHNNLHNVVWCVIGVSQGTRNMRPLGDKTDHSLASSLVLKNYKA